MKLPSLYKKTKTGATQVCNISYKNDTYTVEWGQLDGRMQVKTTVCTPKNIGKSNETTGAAQAKSEAKAKHASKVKAGYSESQEALSEVRLPQKVKTYIGNENKITFPAYSTPKLNGVNATYWLLPDDSLKVTSRGGNEYPPIPHLEKEIRFVMKVAETNCLNGELYIHGEHLQNIVSAVKKPKDLSKQLSFNVFEFPTKTETFKEKHTMLNLIAATRTTAYSEEPELKDAKTAPSVTAIRSTKVDSYDEIEVQYNLAVASGYEGTVIYNADSIYKFNERSSSVYKYKKAIDAEFKFLSFTLDKNSHPVLTCETKEGATFKVKPKGTSEERIAMIATLSSQVGSWYKVEFEAYSKDGIPLKPVGLCFRNCDKNGKPNE